MSKRTKADIKKAADQELANTKRRLAALYNSMLREVKRKRRKA